MTTKNEIRKAVSIKLSNDEKSFVQSQADNAGLAFGTYCRQILLGYQIQNNISRQAIASILCRYHNYAEDISTVRELRQMIHAMETELWQIIK